MCSAYDIEVKREGTGGKGGRMVGRRGRDSTGKGQGGVRERKRARVFEASWPGRELNNQRSLACMLTFPKAADLEEHPAPGVGVCSAVGLRCC